MSAEEKHLIGAAELIQLTQRIRGMLVDVLDREKVHPGTACLAMALIQAAVLDGAVDTFSDPEDLAELREGIQATLGFTVKEEA